jgi:hypothetical protein
MLTSLGRPFIQPTYTKMLIRSTPTEDALDDVITSEHIRVVALVFYGRREFVSILNHYLKVRPAVIQ